ARPVRAAPCRTVGTSRPPPRPGTPAVPADPPVPAAHGRVIGKHLTGAERTIPPAAGALEPRRRLTVPGCQPRKRRNARGRPVEQARDRAAPRTPRTVRLAPGHPPVVGDVAHKP